jgi:hypothetical protein
MVRKANSTEWVRSRVTSVREGPGVALALFRRRMAYQARNTTRDQPMPIRSRLAPVMLARASEQGDSPVAPGPRQVRPNSW